VVGTRTGGIPAAIQEGEGGWLIEPDDTRTLTDIVRQLIHSPDSFRIAGRKARQRVLRESTWECYGQRFSSVLQSAGIVYG
jgi:phosphatidyl-myo-inositol dimannoside synthase